MYRLKNHCIAFTFLFLIFFHSKSQVKHPVLTRIISFDELKKKSVERKAEWKNPDGSQEELKFVEMAIPINNTIKERTREFVHSVYGLDSVWLNPKMIVFHAMGDGDLKTSLEVSSFLNDQIPSGWGNLSKAGLLPNGAHFIIDRDGTVICLSHPFSPDGQQVSYAPDNHRWPVRRHQDGNPVAIGIENVTPANDYTSLTDAQIESNAKLARWLIWFEKGKIEFIASHHQFNDDKNYDRFLSAFHLQNHRKQFRTKGRKDVGDKNLDHLLTLIKKYGSGCSLFF